jgi:glycerophosphoryl diester phosphodiesterase
LSSVRVQGHRGWRAKYPENSLLSFEAAARLPIAAIELDIVEAADGRFVLAHDPWVLDDQDRVRGLRAMSIDDLKALRIPSSSEIDFPEQEKHDCPYLLLDELLALWPASGPTLNIEIKSKAIWEDRYQSDFSTLCDRLIEQVNACPLDVHLQSFDWRLVQQLYTLSAHPVSWLCETPRELNDFQQSIPYPGQHLHGLGLHYSLVNENLVKWCEYAGLDMAVWTVNSMEVLDGMLDCGVTNIITDEPLKVIEHLKSKDIHPETNFWESA